MFLRLLCEARGRPGVLPWVPCLAASLAVRAVMRGPCDEHGGHGTCRGARAASKTQLLGWYLKALVSGPYAAHLILTFFLISLVTDSFYMLAGIDLPVCGMPSEHWCQSHSTISGLLLSTGPSVSRPALGLLPTGVLPPSTGHAQSLVVARQCVPSSSAWATRALQLDTTFSEKM